MRAERGYGVNEGVKRSITSALQKTLTEDFRDDLFKQVSRSVGMEFPTLREQLPSLWVKFSLNTIQHAGFSPIENHVFKEGSEHYVRTLKWGRFTGTVTLTVVALSNQERDKISDALVNAFLFADLEDEGDNLFKRIQEDDYIFMNIQRDILTPRGQAELGGRTPWNSEDPLFEDTYAFSISGEFASDPRTRELVRLRDIILNYSPYFVDETSEDEPEGPVIGDGVVPGQWV